MSSRNPLLCFGRQDHKTIHWRMSLTYHGAAIYIDSVENATSLQSWLTNSGLPLQKMAIDRVDIREREECAQLTSQCAQLQDRMMASALSYKTE
ncbi:hypothetical protein Bca4012_078698 [Brassica carinata]